MKEGNKKRFRKYTYDFTEYIDDKKSGRRHDRSFTKSARNQEKIKKI